MEDKNNHLTEHKKNINFLWQQNKLKKHNKTTT